MAAAGAAFKRENNHYDISLYTVDTGLSGELKQNGKIYLIITCIIVKEMKLILTL